MSKLTARAKNGIVSVKTPAGDGWYTSDLTVEESRALRLELEKAEGEAGRKSAYQAWACSPSDTPGDLKEAWNAAIDAVLALPPGAHPYVRLADIEALKEPVK